MSAKLGAPFQVGKLWEAASARGGRYLVEVDAQMSFVLLTHLNAKSYPKLICSHIINSLLRVGSGHDSFW